MTDILKFNDAVENENFVLKFGSTRIGRHIKDPYTSREIDLMRDRESALNNPAHINNPNVINFEKYIKEWLKGKDPVKYQYFLEVPFPNPNVSLFSNLYHKFGAKEDIKRHWFRSDIYFPELGIAIELDSDAYHEDLEVALDNAKENLIYEYYGIPTKMRINLASTKEWENKRRFRALTDLLDRCETIKPIILYDTIVDSWNIKNSDILPFFPYVESCVSNYYTKHDSLYKQREVYLNKNILPETLKITISRPSIQAALQNVYKRIKNVDLVITGA